MAICPICSKSVPQSLLERHVNTCLDSQERPIEVEPAGKRKNAFDALGLTRGKRTKVEPRAKKVPSLTQLLIEEKRIKRERDVNPDDTKGEIDSNEIITSTQNEEISEEPIITVPESTPSKAFEKSFHANNRTFHERSITSNSHVPLAHLLRPQTLADFQGQEKLLGENGLLRNIIQADHIPSFILWGPPGVGKTSLARIIARTTNHKFIEVSGAESSAKRLKEIFQQSENETKLTGRQTILFLDEIHRFNKAVQDLLLPVIEKGVVTVIGATTENPSFSVNNALLSRVHTFIMEPLGEIALLKILTRALFQVNKFRKARNLHLISLNREAMSFIAELSLGDSRTAINILECINAYLSMYKVEDMLGIVHITDDMLRQLFKNRHFHQLYDKSGDNHYDTISAFHKSVRGSDADAAIFYLVKMLVGGEDPLFLLRRMIVIASEDIGLRDLSCLPFAIAAKEAFEFVGMPEGEIILAHCAVKLARAPKSTKSYRALRTAQALMAEKPEISKLPVPVHLRNAPTRLMKELGYGDTYRYNPEFKHGKVKQTYLPKEVQDKHFVEDTHLGKAVDELVNKEVYEEAETEYQKYLSFKKEWREERKKEDGERRKKGDEEDVEGGEDGENIIKEDLSKTENDVTQQDPIYNPPSSLQNELDLMREEIKVLRNELNSIKTQKAESSPKKPPKLIRNKPQFIPKTFSYDENLSKEDQPEYFDGEENDVYSDDPDCTSNFECPYDEFRDGNSQPEEGSYYDDGTYYDPDLE